VAIVFFAAIIFTGLVAIANLAIRAASADAMSNMDISIFTLMREMRNAPADEIMIVITMLGDTLVMAALALTIIGWLIWRKAYRAAYAAAIAIVAAKLFEVAVKYGIQRARPLELAYSGVELFSFPSGHATMAAVIFGILAVLVSHSMGRWSKAMVYAICAIMVVSIGYSRVYLGAHWLSDVLAGLLFGTVMMAAFGVAIEAIPPRRIKPLGLFGAAFIVFIIAGAAHVSTNFSRAEEVYARPQNQILVPMAEWVARDWEKLPARRIDLAGKPKEVFIAQYAGELDRLSESLQKAGWTLTPNWTWRESLPYLNPNSTLLELPPRPALHEGLKAKLTMTRVPDGSSDEREVLRAYKTTLATADGDVFNPIYMVSLTREVRTNTLHLYSIPSLLAASPADISALRSFFAAGQGLSRLAEHERFGDVQDLISATP
jgi:undecaprenyl-diphosphatase